MGRKGQPDRRLRRLRPRLPHRSEGKGYVLFEAPRREITSVAVGANGTIYAASVGDKSHNPLPPLPVQGVGSASPSPSFSRNRLQAVNASTSLPEGTEIYALTEGQAPRKLWSSKDDIVYALAARPDGLLALTGNRGHIFRIQDDGSYADIAHLEAQQGLSLAVRDSAGIDGVLIGTGNTGKVLSELGAAENARVRQRRSRCRRIGPLRPRRNRARLIGL